jgi:ketosteroid isomerase-like protein
MSQENIDAFNRAVEALNRRDVDALLEELDPDVEWRPALPVVLAGKATVYRGHDGVRTLLHDLYEVLDEIQLEYWEVRDVGERIVGIGRMRTRGKGSGAETESPFASVTWVKDGRGIEIRGFLDPDEALEAAGLEE